MHFVFGALRQFRLLPVHYKTSTLSLQGSFTTESIGLSEVNASSSSSPSGNAVVVGALISKRLGCAYSDKARTQRAAGEREKTLRHHRR
jgi:hypothetical protein